MAPTTRQAPSTPRLWVPLPTGAAVRRERTARRPNDAMSVAIATTAKAKSGYRENRA